LWKEYSSFTSLTSGNYVGSLPGGLEFKEYSYASDSTERILSVKYEDGNVKTYEYSAKMTSTGPLPVVTVTEPNGVKTRYTFDLADNLLLVEQGFDGSYSITASWLEGLDEERIIDPLDREIRIIKDGAGNILEKEHFDSGKVVLMFDDVFRTLSITNPMGTKTEFYYREGTNVLSSQIMDRNENFGPVFNCVNEDCSCSSDADCLNAFTCQGGSCS